MQTRRLLTVGLLLLTLGGGLTGCVGTGTSQAYSREITHTERGFNGSSVREANPEERAKIEEGLEKRYKELKGVPQADNREGGDQK